MYKEIHALINVNYLWQKVFQHKNKLKIQKLKYRT